MRGCLEEKILVGFREAVEEGAKYGILDFYACYGLVDPLHNAGIWKTLQ